jgi:hypothetical protein
MLYDKTQQEAIATRTKGQQQITQPQQSSEPASALQYEEQKPNEKPLTYFLVGDIPLLKVQY